MRSVLSFLLLSALLGPAALVHAQAKAPTPVNGDAAEGPEYKQAIDAALEEYRLQHYDEARSLFERAHAIDPNARTLRGLGMVEFERRHYVRAAELLEAALASKKKPLTDEQRKAVEELLTRTRQFISNYAVEVQPANEAIRVELDGKPVEIGPERKLSLEAGEHSLRISAPNAVPRELQLDVKGGENQTLHIELEVKTATDTPPPVQQPPREPPAPLRRERNVLGIALTSGGGALAAIGGALGGIALMEANDVKSKDDAAADRAHSLAIGADVVLGVGIATAVTGIALLIWKRPRHADVATAKARVDSLFPHLKVSF